MNIRDLCIVLDKYDEDMEVVISDRECEVYSIDEITIDYREKKPVVGLRFNYN